jgi:hypothetical protein
VNDVDRQVIDIYRSMLLSLQRGASAIDRERIAKIFAEIVNRTLGFAPAEEGAEAASVLNAEGYLALGRVLSPDQAAEIRGHFEARPCFNGHVPADGDGVPRLVKEARAFHYGSYPLADIIEAPHLLELANSPHLLAIAEHYLGCTPTLYSLNAWWSFAGHPTGAKYAQGFHRDLDDFRFCTLFVYLTDVDLAAGPHVYVRRTHREPLSRAHMEGPGQAGLRRFSPEDQVRLLNGMLFESDAYGSDPVVEVLFSDLIDTVIGPAGTAILADTTGFHKGILPKDRDRLMFWARYGLYTNLGPFGEPVPWSSVAHRLAPTHRLRYVNRQILSG